MTLLKTLLFTILLPGTVTVYLPCWLLGQTSGLYPPSTLLGIAGAAALLFGILVYGWCAWDFTYAGKGTPAPLDPPKILVVRGLYRYSRNPMYVGVLSVLLGETLWFASGRLLGYAAVVWLLFQLFITQYEEPHLQQKFGAEYQHYRQTVPRWFLTFRNPQTAHASSDNSLVP